jgi:hypothetical protein
MTEPTSEQTPAAVDEDPIETSENVVSAQDDAELSEDQDPTADLDEVGEDDEEDRA